MTVRLPDALSFLPAEEQAVVTAVLDCIVELPGLQTVFLGGSRSLAAPAHVGSDVDFWAIVTEPNSAKRTLLERFCRLSGVRLVHDSGSLPWLGDLVTVLCFEGCRFAVDVGLCHEGGMTDLNPGPNPVLVWGDPSLLRGLVVQRYRAPATMRVQRVLVNLVKARKSLERGQLWNAIECAARARREIMGLLRDERAKVDIDYSRPDRDIESVVTPEENALLSATLPHYSTAEVAASLARIGEFGLAWAADRIPPSLASELRDLAGWMQNCK